MDEYFCISFPVKRYVYCYISHMTIDRIAPALWK